MGSVWSAVSVASAFVSIISFAILRFACKVNDFIPYIVILSAFYRFLSLIECNPISPILVTWSQFAFREDFFYLAVFVSKPCIVPASAHI